MASRQPIAQTLAVLACVLLLPALAATWISAVATNTDTYVRTVAPLAQDRAVTDAVSKRFTEVAIDNLMAVKPAPVSTSTFREALEPVVQTEVANLLSSDQFATVWEQANRRLHRLVVMVLEDNDAVREPLDLDLTELVQRVIDDVSAELGVSSVVLAPQFTYQMLDPDQVDKARAGFTLLEELGIWLPVAWLVLSVAALVVGVRRTAVGSTLSAGSAVVLGLTAAAIALGKRWAVDQVPLEDQAVARAVIDQVTEDPVVWVWVGLAAAIVIWLTLRFVPGSRPANARGTYA
ncbi:MAG: hypothetical protein ACSLEW_05040 [Nocardioides sp.]